VKETLQASNPERVTDPQPDPTDIRIAAVTDDHRLREELSYGFPQQVDVIENVDARDAIRSMRETVPSVVVVDLQTGSSGGISLLKEMQQHPSLASVPVLVLLEREQDAWLAKIFGAAAHLVKPVETGELVAGLLSLVH
jgi:DNA-binding response OmpR family regulator